MLDLDWNFDLDWNLQKLADLLPKAAETHAAGSAVSTSGATRSTHVTHYSLEAVHLDHSHVQV